MVNRPINPYLRVAESYVSCGQVIRSSRLVTMYYRAVVVNTGATYNEYKWKSSEYEGSRSL